MKNIATSFLKGAVILPAVLMACMVVTAQRGDRNGKGAGPQRGGAGGNSQQQTPRGGYMGTQQERPNFGQPRSGNNQSRDIGQGNNTGRNFRDRNLQSDGNPPGSSVTQSQRPSRTFLNTTDDRNGNARPGNSTYNQPDQRDRTDNTSRYGSNNGYNRTNAADQQRNGAYNRNNGYYNGSSRYGYYQGRRVPYYGNPYRYAYNCPGYGQRYRRLSFNFNVIPFGGIGYCYNSGVFYRPFENYYLVVAPPIGININILPTGYSRVHYGADEYYFYGNTYYLEYNHSYTVVEPPIGAKLPALPRGAKEVSIDNERYYEDNGTYYLEEFNEKNERLYTVVGVNGILNSDQVNRIINGSPNAINPPVSNHFAPQSQGSVYSSLPANSKKVLISGHAYYRAPDDVYYEAITDGENITYRVVSN